MDVRVNYITAIVPERKWWQKDGTYVTTISNAIALSSVASLTI